MWTFQFLVASKIQHLCIVCASRIMSQALNHLRAPVLSSPHPSLEGGPSLWHLRGRVKKVIGQEFSWLEVALANPSLGICSGKWRHFH